MAVLEAWSYSLPVIMTAGCNIPEGFEARAAIEIGPEATSIAEGLERFVALPQSSRQQIGRHGRRLVETKFAWPRIADQMVNVYEWMLGRHERPDCVRMS